MALKLVAKSANELGNRQQSQEPGLASRALGAAQNIGNTIEPIARQGLRTAARIGETTLGLPGDIASGIGTIANTVSGGYLPSYQDIQNKLPVSIPTSEDLRKNVTQRLTGEYLEPKNKGEQTLDDFAELATTLYAPGKAAKLIGKGLGKLGKAGELAKGVFHAIDNMIPNEGLLGGLIRGTGNILFGGEGRGISESAKIAGKTIGAKALSEPILGEAGANILSLGTLLKLTTPNILQEAKKIGTSIYEGSRDLLKNPDMFGQAVSLRSLFGNIKNRFSEAGRGASMEDKEQIGKLIGDIEDRFKTKSDFGLTKKLRKNATQASREAAKKAAEGQQWIGMKYQDTWDIIQDINQDITNGTISGRAVPFALEIKDALYDMLHGAAKKSPEFGNALKDSNQIWSAVHRGYNLGNYVRSNFDPQKPDNLALKAGKSIFHGIQNFLTPVAESAGVLSRPKLQIIKKTIEAASKGDFAAADKIYRKLL